MADPLQDTSVAHRLAAVRASIETAARRAGRDPAAVRLVAVTKGVQAARIREAVAVGQRIFGENRVQELMPKTQELAGEAAVSWHMIGHLQRNKVRHVVPVIAMLHSLDRLELATELDRQLQRIGRRLAVLVEVNTSGEPTKYGVAPEEAAELVREAAKLPSLEVRGLMTIGPHTTDQEAVRRAFRLLRQLRDRIREEGTAGPSFGELSMGMSSDFPIAVEEGATLVRVGTAIFGPRAP
ncbi:YggS family pyridoxal phosphate-dependent enzyme [Carboxydochorda subterranea]|uniref:Pyridoxal phosphate homeostasis protein n=1 Tax=Carboxydichorda subterranea TaxID=3109565 RepID=A0ABZ1BUD6_9FIRM|nr:YggS family pyridoxal phosphate-dependent enzyme [Limnochorda sp. L945t]WRP16141.1 YggS family pyridoxal phosphate-dependent enzyme [Limnochorda sp. L945t]